MFWILLGDYMLKKGTGTFLEYVITSVFLMYFLLLIVGLFMKRYTIEKFDLYTNKIAREIVVCDSLESARQSAQTKMEDYFEEISLINPSEISVSVDYALGSNADWHKGNFITLTIYGKIKSAIMITDTDYEVSVMVMIEHN